MPDTGFIFAKRLLGPSDEEDNATLPFGLYIIADGYSDEGTFVRDCNSLKERIKLIAPFNYLSDSKPIAIYSCYSVASANSASLIIGEGNYDPAAIANPTPMAAYFQRPSQPDTRGQLYLDYARVVDVCKRVLVYSNVQGTYLPLVLAATDIATSYQYLPGAILILKPDVSNFDVLSTRLAEVELEHNPTSTEPLFFASTSCNGSYERIAARSIGVALGLGDEFEELPGGPNEAEGNALNMYPNLLYCPNEQRSTLGDKSFKWKYLTGNRQLKTNFKADPTGAKPNNAPGPLVSDTINLWEGGGGYSNNIYRSAQDCIMRQKPGFGNVLIKGSEDTFCPICLLYLTKAVNGEYSTKRLAEATLDTQLTEYNRVNWKVTHIYANTPGPDFKQDFPIEYTIGPDDPSFNLLEFTRSVDPSAFWGYRCRVDSDGLFIDNVKIHQSTYYNSDKDLVSSGPNDTRDVFSGLSFTDFKVVFSDDPENAEPHSINIGSYLSQRAFVFNRSYQGTLGVDNLYQTGLMLALKIEEDGWPHMEIELSVVMRGPSPDFDPGGVAVALKTYPQIQFKWRRKAGVSRGIERFEGTVRAVSNVKHYMYDSTSDKASKFIAHAMEMGGASAHPMNDASCFTDSNVSQLYGHDALGREAPSRMAREDVKGNSPFNDPTWASLFDYYHPHAVTASQPEKEFTAVHGPGEDTRYARVRKMFVEHSITPESKTDLFITKFPRQGAYDNIHVNGYMGKHNAFVGANLQPDFDVNDIVEEDVVAAPFCGMDCFHMHWRWSLLSDTIAKVNPTGAMDSALATGYPDFLMHASSFRGWSKNRAHAIVGAPLVPPNQRINVLLQAATLAQPGNEKVVAYTSVITKPAPGENQVILEQGMGWAMIYSDEFSVNGAIAATLIAPPIPSGVFNVVNTNDKEAAFDKLYDFIRFHHEYNISALPPFLLNTVANSMKVYNHAQVPDGRDIPSQVWPSALLDWHLAFYKRLGDIYNLNLYPFDKQIIVEENKLIGISIEDL